MFNNISNTGYAGRFLFFTLMNWIYEIMVTALGFTGFAVLHSLLARPALKRKLFGRWPGLKSYYRLLYTLFAVVTFGIWYLFSPFPQGMLYRIPFPYSVFFRIMQGVGVIGFFLSLKAINVSKFVGLQPIISSRSQSTPFPPESSDELVTDGLYAWVRHPLYTASIMVLLFNPVMSAKLGLITLLVILYCWIGTVYEERNLIAEYGREYKEYRQKVPRFIPKIPLF